MSTVDAAGPAPAPAPGRVRRLHSKLRGHDPATGRAFRLDDPQGLLWVHCGEIDSYVDVAMRSGALSEADADRYVAESGRAAEVVGAADAPRSRAELKAYFDEIRPRLRLTDEAITGTVNLMTARLPAPCAAGKDSSPRAWASASSSASSSRASAAPPRRTVPGRPSRRPASLSQWAARWLAAARSSRNPRCSARYSPCPVLPM